MKVFIQSKNNVPHNKNFYYAYDGFKEMGFEIIPFSSIDELKVANKEDIIVGYINIVRYRLSFLNIPIPEIDYPSELSSYLGRRIWKDKINHINNCPELWPVFVKPIEDKRFTGILVRSPKDLIGCGCWNEDIEIYCSSPVKFLAEWRCFVRYNKILDIRRYKGNWKHIPNYDLIEQVISEYTSAPNGYAIDFGLTESGDTLLIEVNDGYSLGSYGLFTIDYAKLLSARWAELTNTTDKCDF